MNISPLKATDYVLILTGAGISAESGLKTFRDSDGLWENHNVEDVATPQAFQRDPRLVWRFYKARYFQSLEVEPNPGHFALVELEKAIQDRFLLVTQNVDGLHSRAGSKRIYEMHGTFSNCFCIKCNTHFPMTEIDSSPEIPLCSACGGYLRPDIVWFGEVPYFLEEIYTALSKATVFISIGTSGAVYPAAHFIAVARQNNARTICVNLNQPDNSSYVDSYLEGKAGEILPSLVERMLM